MNISCTQENLLKAVSTVSRVVGIRSTLPILSHILLKAQDGRLKVIGTDLEIGIIAGFGVKMEQEGSLTLPAKLLTDFVVNNPDEKINIEANAGKVKLSSQHFTGHLTSLDPEDFPLIPEVKDTQSITLQAQILKEAINKTVFASAIDETRPVLTGVSLSLEGNKLILASTDSYRLAEKKITVSENTGKKIKTIVPARTMQELARLISLQTEEVKISIAENQIAFDADSYKIISRVLEGEFPDYSQIIPKDISTHIKINLNKLSNALKLSMSFAREVSNNIKIKAQPGENLEIIATSPQVGDSTSSLEADIKGDKIEMSFNAKYLLDIMNVLGGEDVVIELSGKTSPAIIKPIKDNDFLALLMPLRLDDEH